MIKPWILSRPEPWLRNQPHSTQSSRFMYQEAVIDTGAQRVGAKAAEEIERLVQPAQQVQPWLPLQRRASRFDAARAEDRVLVAGEHWMPCCGGYVSLVIAVRWLHPSHSVLFARPHSCTAGCLTRECQDLARAEPAFDWCRSMDTRRNKSKTTGAQQQADRCEHYPCHADHPAVLHNSMLYVCSGHGLHASCCCSSAATTMCAK